MQDSTDQEVGPTLQEVRLILIGGRWSGKSASANTILRKERFECGRIRTGQSEVRREVVEGRKIIVVDSPGWQSSLSLTEIPEKDKLNFRLNASMCPPGPNAFLLVIPKDTAFSAEERKTVEEHMKLLGEQAWRHTIVLFTCGDYLKERTIEQHIESEGKALKWVVEKCRNRYHVFNNRDRSNSSQVSVLLEKIDQMVQNNSSDHYKVDEHTMRIIENRQQEIAAKAAERRRTAEEQNQQMKALISAEEMTPIQNLRVVLLGSQKVGKTSIVNTILGFKEQENGQRTTQSVVHQGCVGEQEITLVDTPGWWKSFSEIDTPEVIKDEVKRGVFLCPPGPHVFLLVVDADASFNAIHKNAVTTHLELFGKAVWSHTIMVFTRGDWLGSHTIEEYIEGEGEALQSLVDLCGNRYHVLDNKNSSDATQVTELLDKITGMVTVNDDKYFTPDEQMYNSIEDRRRKVEEDAAMRQYRVNARKEKLRGSLDQLQEIRTVLLSQRSFGKTATGNVILRKDVFATHETQQCQVDVAIVVGRLVTVIDSPGWQKESSHSTEDADKETVRGLLLSPLGVHAVMLVIPIDLKFKESYRAVLEEYMDFFDESVWKHAMVLFTHGDTLADKSIEEHIERHSALRGLVDKCGNRYHVFNNLNKNDVTQVTELFEKIEEMVAGNKGKLFCPNTREVHLRIEENCRKRLLKNAMRLQLQQELSRRELELMIGFRDVLLDLQTDAKESAPKIKPKLQVGELPKIKVKMIGQKKKEEKEEFLHTKITQEIEKLNRDILRSTNVLRSSMEFEPPDLKEDSPLLSIVKSLSNRRGSSGNSDRVYEWLSNVQSSRDVDHQATLNYSQTSGYRSRIHDSFDLDGES